MPLGASPYPPHPSRHKGRNVPSRNFKQYPEHEVLISQWTHEALGSRRAELELVPLGQLPIRGKAETVGIWSVRGRAPARH